MNKLDQETLLLEQLLDKYKFTRPVPEEMRQDILASKKKNLVRVLKTVGAFSAIHGVFLSVYFGFKKLGIGIPIAKFIISSLAVTAVTLSGYYAVTTLASFKTPLSEKRSPQEETREKSKWVDRITLYNGRIIEGSIISRGAKYRVKTGEGIMEIPRGTIKVIKPLRVETETVGNQPKE